jgi:hypothetical protein
MTQPAMAKASRTSLLRLALRLSRCESMSTYAFDSDVLPQRANLGRGPPSPAASAACAGNP